MVVQEGGHPSPWSKCCPSPASTPELPLCGSLGWGISSSSSLGEGCTGRKAHVDPEGRPGLFGKEHPVGVCVWIFGARCRGKAPGGHIPVAPERVRGGPSEAWGPGQGPLLTRSKGRPDHAPAEIELSTVSGETSPTEISAPCE